MSLPWFLIFLIVLLGLYECRQHWNQKKLVPDWFSAKPQLLSAEGQRLFSGLSDALPDWAALCPLVRLSDVVQLENRKNGRRPSALLQHGRLDFVVVERSTTNIVTAVLVESESSAIGARAAHAQRMERILATAGLQIVRIRRGGSYSASELRSLLNLD